MKRLAIHNIVLLIVLLTAPLLLSCEKELELKQEQDKGIAVFALAAPDQPFSARVSRSFSVNTNPDVGLYETSAYYNALRSIYQSQIVISDADVSIKVNDTDTYTLTYNEAKPYEYTCDYVPAVGDKIDLTVKAEGYTTVTSSTTIEMPSNIELVDTAVLYDKEENPELLDIMRHESYNTDTVMDLTLRMHDISSGRRYYRLVVRSISKYNYDLGAGTMLFQSVLDTYASTDVIFFDSQISKSYSGWAANFSNVFENSLFTDGEYTVTVRSRQRRGFDQKVWVELETLSPDMYYFLKSYQIYRVSTDDVYTTPVGLYSNIANGYGIFGSVSRDSLTVHY